MTETEVIRLLAIFSDAKPAVPFQMADWIKYLDVTRVGWSKKKPLNLALGSSRQKSVIAINQLQGQILKLQGVKTVDLLYYDGKIPNGSVCLEAAHLAVDASNAALQRGNQSQARNYLSLACDLYADEVRWLNSQLPNGDASLIEQADSFVSRLLDPHFNNGRSVEVPKPGMVPSVASKSFDADITAKAISVTAEPKVLDEVHSVDAMADDGAASYRDLMESISVTVLVICYEFALLYYFLPTTPAWQIGIAVVAKSVAFRGQAFPVFLKKWEGALKAFFIFAYLPVIVVGLFAALIFKGAAWLLSPVFRIAKSAT